MDAIILDDALVTVDGHDISDHVSSVEILMEFAEVKTPTMGAASDSGTHGVRTDQFNVEVYVDEGSGEVNSILHPLFVGKSTFIVEVRTTSAAISATNPEYRAYCKLFKYSPLSGKVNDPSSTTLEFKCQTPILKDTSPTTAY